MSNESLPEVRSREEMWDETDLDAFLAVKLGQGGEIPSSVWKQFDPDSVARLLDIIFEDY